MLILTHPSFLLGSLGTFALLKLPTLWWGTLFIQVKFYVRFLPNSVGYLFLDGGVEMLFLLHSIFYLVHFSVYVNEFF